MSNAVYTTIQGDTWDAVAYRLWGEERFFTLLMRANPEYSGVLLFPAGVILRVPPAPARLVKQELPPWM